MGLMDLRRDYTMVDVLSGALVLHHFSCKATEKNLEKIKGGALYRVI